MLYNRKGFKFCNLHHSAMTNLFGSKTWVFFIINTATNNHRHFSCCYEIMKALSLVFLQYKVMTNLFLAEKQLLLPRAFGRLSKHFKISGAKSSTWRHDQGCRSGWSWPGSGSDPRQKKSVLLTDCQKEKKTNSDPNLEKQTESGIDLIQFTLRFFFNFKVNKNQILIPKHNFNQLL